MSTLKIGDLNFCETVSGNQVQGGVNSSWDLLISHIRKNFQEKTFSGKQDDLVIEGYLNETGYAVIGSSPDEKKQFVGLVKRSDNNGIVAINYNKVETKPTI